MNHGLSALFAEIIGPILETGFRSRGPGKLIQVVAKVILGLTVILFALEIVRRSGTPFSLALVLALTIASVIVLAAIRAVLAKLPDRPAATAAPAGVADPSPVDHPTQTTGPTAAAASPETSVEAQRAAIWGDLSGQPPAEAEPLTAPPDEISAAVPVPPPVVPASPPRVIPPEFFAMAHRYHLATGLGACAGSLAAYALYGRPILAWLSQDGTLDFFVDPIGQLICGAPAALIAGFIVSLMVVPFSYEKLAPLAQPQAWRGGVARGFRVGFFLYLPIQFCLILAYIS